MSRQLTRDFGELVASAVAERDGIDPIELKPPLAEVIDPDALDRLLGTGSAEAQQDVEVRFAYRSHDVIVDSDGEVEIE